MKKNEQGIEDHPRDAPVNSYDDYLNLDDILSAQTVHTTAHDELLFIIQHQTSELWMKLIIHELSVVREDIAASRLEPAFKTLSRVARIFEQLNSAWDILRTMTPSEYTEFRRALGTSSGLQSFQYRLIEYMLGNRVVEFVENYKDAPLHYKALQEELARPSIYDLAVALLYRMVDGFDIPAPPYQLLQPREHVQAIQNHWKVVYDSPHKYWSLYELAEKLVDLEDYFRRWRFNHVTTVERIIGNKLGTGGTIGVPLLRRRLEVVLFPELWRVRGDL